MNELYKIEQNLDNVRYICRINLPVEAKSRNIVELLNESRL